jgi:hypothetical protein
MSIRVYYFKPFSEIEVDGLDIRMKIGNIRSAFFIPHPNPLPQGERGDNFWQYGRV